MSDLMQRDKAQFSRSPFASCYCSSHESDSSVSDIARVLQSFLVLALCVVINACLSSFFGIAEACLARNPRHHNVGVRGWHELKSDLVSGGLSPCRKSVFDFGLQLRTIGACSIGYENFDWKLLPHARTKR